MDTEFVAVARLMDLPATGGLDVMVGGQKITLFKTKDGVFATDGICPHRGGPLSAGWVEAGKVFCPLHGWEFDLRTGVCPTREDRPIQCYPVRVEGDEVQVNLRRGAAESSAEPAVRDRS
jgi:nitrite reductase (NADH) small subunit